MKWADYSWEYPGWNDQNLGSQTGFQFQNPTLGYNINASQRTISTHAPLSLENQGQIFQKAVLLNNEVPIQAKKFIRKPEQ